MFHFYFCLCSKNLLIWHFQINSCQKRNCGGGKMKINVQNQKKKIVIFALTSFYPEQIVMPDMWVYWQTFSTNTLSDSSEKEEKRSIDIGFKAFFSSFTFKFNNTFNFCNILMAWSANISKSRWNSTCWSCNWFFFLFWKRNVHPWFSPSNNSKTRLASEFYVMFYKTVIIDDNL